MEKLFTQEVIKMLSIVGIAGLSFMGLIGRYIAKARGSFQPYLKPTVFYLLAFMLVMAVIALIGWEPLFQRPGLIYIIAQLFCVGVGILHLRTLPRVIKWAGGEKTFWLEVLFTLVLCCFGYVAFVIVFKMLNKEGFHFLLASCVLWVPIVQLVYETFKKAVDIPVKVYKEWYYPLHTEVKDPDEEKLKHLLIISFQFQKKTSDTFFTNFRAKAPVDMEFGQLFYFFINDYNERHPNAKIQYTNEKGEPYGWFFYRKPKWYQFGNGFIDDTKTFFANRIRENDIIVCLRN
jgi:hypothetical protein